MLITCIVSLLCFIGACSLHYFLVFLLVLFNTSLLWSIGVFRCILVMLYWCFLMCIYFALLVFIDNLSAHWHIFILLCWCSSTLFGCALLLLISTSWLCFVGACLHLLIMFCWCSLLPPYCILLVLIVTSLLYFVSAHCYLLIVLCWHLLMPSCLRYLSNP